MSKGCNVLLTWLKHGFLKRYSSYTINKEQKKERKKKMTILIPQSSNNQCTNSLSNEKKDKKERKKEKNENWSYESRDTDQRGQRSR